MLQECFNAVGAAVRRASNLLKIGYYVKVTGEHRTQSDNFLKHSSFAMVIGVL